MSLHPTPTKSFSLQKVNPKWSPRAHFAPSLLSSTFCKVCPSIHNCAFWKPQTVQVRGKVANYKHSGLLNWLLACFPPWNSLSVKFLIWFSLSAVQKIYIYYHPCWHIFQLQTWGSRVIMLANAVDGCCKRCHCLKLKTEQVQTLPKHALFSRLLMGAMIVQKVIRKLSMGLDHWDFA